MRIFLLKWTSRDRPKRSPVESEDAPGRIRARVTLGGLASTVSVLDARTLRLVGRVPVGRRPWGIAVSRDGRWVYTANGLSNDVSVIDARTLRVAATIPVGQRPWGIALSR